MAGRGWDARNGHLTLTAWTPPTGQSRFSKVYESDGG